MNVAKSEIGYLDGAHDNYTQLCRLQGRYRYNSVGLMFSGFKTYYAGRMAGLMGLSLHGI